LSSPISWAAGLTNSVTRIHQQLLRRSGFVTPPGRICIAAALYLQECGRVHTPHSPSQKSGRRSNWSRSPPRNSRRRSKRLRWISTRGRRSQVSYAGYLDGGPTSSRNLTLGLAGVRTVRLVSGRPPLGKFQARFKPLIGLGLAQHGQHRIP